MRVFIAEKPSQGRDIARVLGCHNKGDGYIANQRDVVTWGFGHLLQPADPEIYDEKFKKWNMDDLPIIPEKWKLSPNPKAKAQLKTVKDWIGKASEVVIATDADREGELIARLILGNARYNGSLKRLWLSALDDASIKKALSNLKDGGETEALFWAGLGRQRADWMTGMSYTRAATLLFGGQGNVCSVGRVQTPTLRLIVERDKEIANFVSKPFYTITADFKQDNSQFQCEWIVPDYAKGDEEGRCLELKYAESVKQKCLKQQGTITQYDTQKKSQQAPLPFSLSDLQKAANNKYGYDAKKVLNTAQALYETHKATTYPRSDCQYLPLSQFEEANSIIQNLSAINSDYQDLIPHCDSAFKSRCWNDKKVNESSHHGIIPTNNDKVNLANMTQIERNVFDLIVRQYLAQFMGHYVFDETVLVITCVDEQFKAKGVVPLSLGWKQAFLFQKTEKKEKDDNSNMPNKDVQLPVLDKNKAVINEAINIHDRKTSPPSHYTDATLIAAMKNCGRKIDDEEAKKIFAEVQGIGTEATRADIIETLKSRSYIESKGKSLISTAKGKAIIEQLPDALSNITITAEWEQVLADVAKGKNTYTAFIGGIQKTLADNIDVLKKLQGTTHQLVAHECPNCGKGLVRHKKKQGKGYFWGCSGYKEGCNTIMDDARGKPKARAEQITSDIQCPTCQKHNLIQRTGKNKKPYWACSGYPDCKSIFYDDNGSPNFNPKPKEAPKKSGKICPKCNSDLVIRKSQRGEFLGCSNYPKCKHAENITSSDQVDAAH